MTDKLQCLLMGAAGRDFHNFQTFFRGSDRFHVVAFTATQIPFIETRVYPASLAGPDYPAGIPIYAEELLEELIGRHHIDFVFLAYSDLSYEDVMQRASRAMARGASFALLGPRASSLRCPQPVIAVTAVRTGVGKSPVSQWLGSELKKSNHRPGILRHPMPYGDLERQVVERFAQVEDLDKYQCTIEEREEYEPYLELGLPIFAGVDYQQILAAATAESDVVLWDGGNNDFPFVQADLMIVLVDALRPGHETKYFPGEVNLRMADVILINKVDGAPSADVDRLRQRVASICPDVPVLTGNLVISTDHPELIRDKRVVIVEDGPTLTHGGMAYGAGWIAARQFAAREIVDPRDFAQGTLRDAFARYSHLQHVLPALGYSPQQQQDLQQSIEACGAETVIDASPARLDRILSLSLPVARVRYRFEQQDGPPLMDFVHATIGNHQR